MLIISGTFRIKAGAEDAAVAAVTRMAQASRAEPGCLAYAFYRDLEDDGSYRVFERWQDLDALRAHFATEHMAEFRNAIPEFADGPADVVRYEVASEGPVLPD